MDMTITGRPGFKPARGLDRDKLHMTPRSVATRVAHQSLNAVQQESPEALVMGVATLFAAVCRRCKVDPVEAHRLGLKMLDAPFDGDPLTTAHVEVLRDFIGGRVMGEDVTIG